MAYLAQQMNDPAPSPSRQRAGGGGGFFRSVSSFLHPVRPRTTSASSSLPSGAAQGAASSASGRVVNAATAAESEGDQRSTAPSGTAQKTNRHHATSSAPAASPPTGTAGAVGGRGPPEDPAALSTRLEDADLFRFAVDYDELVGVMNAPVHDKKSSPASTGPTPARAGAGGGGESSGSILCPSALHFTCIGRDAERGITLYSSPVPGCPVHLMRASVVMPCTGAEFLQYMDNRVRPMWDTYTEKGYLVRELDLPEAVEAQLARARQQPRTDSLQVSSGATHTQPNEDDDNAANAQKKKSGPPSFAYLPGQRRVALHYLAVRSPVPCLQSRDFELVVAEEVRPDGTAYMRAFSAPFGYCVPVDVDQNRYVRAVCMSGVVARPLSTAAMNDPSACIPPALRHLVEPAALTSFLGDEAGRAASSSASGATTSGTTPPSEKARHSLSHTQGGTTQAHTGSGQATMSSAPQAFCEVSYYGLVHPMGMIPPVLVNMVISAQMSSLRNLQTFILEHPLTSLLPADIQAQRQQPANSLSSDTPPPRPTTTKTTARATNNAVSSSWKEKLLSKL